MEEKTTRMFYLDAVSVSFPFRCASWTRVALAPERYDDDVSVSLSFVSFVLLVR